MKIALYINNILYNTGGTETYTAKIAQALQSIYPYADIFFVTECYNPEDILTDNDFISSINSRCGTTLSTQKCHCDLIMCSQKSWFSRLTLRKKLESSSKKYDLYFYCSRGHYIFNARKNVCIIHFPMERLSNIKKDKSAFTRFRVGLKDKKYAKRYDVFLPNSKFTQGFLSKWWPDIEQNRNILLYPPVISFPFTNEEKKNQILICSRMEQSKKLESLIDTYRGSDYLQQNAKLIIAGDLPKNLEKYGEQLKEYAKGLNIEFITNAPFSKIIELYNESKIFWHSKGFGCDENKDPFLCEHFGITTVEAMRAGCIPIVINKAGQKEIVNETCGFKWDTTEQLIDFTSKVLSDNTLAENLKAGALKRSKDFNMESFTENHKNILKQINLYE